MNKYSFTSMLNFNDLIHTDIEKWISIKETAKAITIALMPNYMKQYEKFQEDVFKYCLQRNIIFRLWRENEETNTHYHGVIWYPEQSGAKKFQNWINKKYGKLLHAPLYDPNGWIEYCTKIQSAKDADIDHINMETSYGDKSTVSYRKMFQLKYMFEPEYEPTDQDYMDMLEWEIECIRSKLNPEIEITLPLELMD